MREEGRNRGPPSAPQRFRKVQHRQAINQSSNQSINQSINQSMHAQARDDQLVLHIPICPYLTIP